MARESRICTETCCLDVLLGEVIERANGRSAVTLPRQNKTIARTRKRVLKQTPPTMTLPVVRRKRTPFASYVK